jgi:hypothetical protein
MTPLLAGHSPQAPRDRLSEREGRLTGALVAIHGAPLT